MNKRKQSGLSIIELMISITLSLLLLMGVLKVFDANRQSSSLTAAYSRLQEGGRTALEMISRDVRIADYWGCAPSTADIQNHLNASNSNYEVWMNPQNQAGVAAGNDVSAGTTINSIDVKTGTDTITIRGARTLRDAKVVDPFMANVTSNITLAAGSGISKGDVVMISDCVGADVFTNTEDDTDTNGTLAHDTGALTGFVDNSTQALSHAYDSTAQISQPFMVQYFVGVNANGQWSLYRGLNGDFSELMRNVDDLQFEFGEDLNGDGAPESYKTAAAVDMDAVVSIRINIEFASSDYLENGTPLSRNYSVTANIRNRTL